MSYRFGSQSQANLAQCHPALQALANRALALSPQDFTVTDGDGLDIEVAPYPVSPKASDRVWIIAGAIQRASAASGAQLKCATLDIAGDFVRVGIAEPTEGQHPASSPAVAPASAASESITKGGPAYEKLIAWLKAEEGLVLKGHWDRIGKVWDIGHGYNLTVHGVPASVAQNLVWTPEQADKALRAEVAAAMVELESHWPLWDDEFDQARQAVFVSGVYQLGVGGASSFVRTIACIRAHDFTGAVQNLQASKWARQTTARVGRIEQMLLTGEWPASVNGARL